MLEAVASALAEEAVKQMFTKKFVVEVIRLFKESAAEARATKGGNMSLSIDRVVGAFEQPTDKLAVGEICRRAAVPEAQVEKAAHAGFVTPDGPRRELTESGRKLNGVLRIAHFSR